MLRKTTTNLTISALAFVLTIITFGSTSFAKQCITSSENGFSVEGRASDSKAYRCPSRYDNFEGISFSKQQGLRCTDIALFAGVEIECENKSKRTRSIKNVILTCCTD